MRRLPRRRTRRRAPRCAADAATAALAERRRFDRCRAACRNFAWQVSCMARARFFVRFARRHGELLGADHANERRVLELTSRAGLSPPVVRCDPAARLLVTHWIDARTSGRPLRECGRPGAYVAAALASLHAAAAAARPARRRLRRAGARDSKPSLAIRASASVAARRARSTVFAACAPAGADRGALPPRPEPAEPADRHGRGGSGSSTGNTPDSAITAFDLASFASQHGLHARQRSRLVDAYRAAGGSSRAGRRLERALWAFDYVQWLWYRAAARAARRRVDAEVARVRADRLASSLRGRASRRLALQ